MSTTTVVMGIYALLDTSHAAACVTVRPVVPLYFVRISVL